MRTLVGGLGWLVAVIAAWPVLAVDAVSVGGRELYRHEFRVSTFTPSAQSEGALEVGPEGNLTVVWSSRRQQHGCYGIYAQRLTPTGVALGGETAVNVWTHSHQMAPDVATDGEGNTWVVWQSHGQDGHAGAIVARRFDAAFRGGDEVLVNRRWRGHQTAPIILTGPHGQALVVWSSIETPDGPPTLRARLFAADGKPIGDEFAVRKDNEHSARVPAAAFASDGGFVIAYSVSDAANGPAGIRLQRFATGGARLGDELLASGPAKSSQIEPIIAAAPDGYILCWLDAQSDGDDYGVLARRLDREGRPLGEPFVVNTTCNGPQTAAAVAVARDGRFVIAWNSSDGDESGIFGQLFAPDGQRRGSEFRINRHLRGKQTLRGAASTRRLVFGPNDALVCAWSGDAGHGDESSVNVTLLTPTPLDLAGKPQGVTAEMKPAEATVALAGGPEPHRPPTFDPADIDRGEREIRLGPGGDFGFTGIVSTGWTPPDPHLAVGPEHIVLMTNGAIAFFTKDGTLTFQDEIEDSYGFWGSVGASGFVFDPEILYDETSGRFFAMAAEAWAPPGNRSYVLVAVSDDSDPNGSWHKYRFDTTSLAGELFDSPNIAVDREAVYITGDGFGISANYPVFVFDKASLLVGDPPAVTNSLTVPTATQSAGIPPVTDDTGLLYMIEHGEGVSNTNVRLIALQDGLGTPTVTTTNLTVAAYGPPEDPPQAGTSARPETFDARFWSVAYRNGSLWATHHVNPDRVVARWYEIAMNGWPLTGDEPELVQSGEIAPGGTVRTFFSAITVDDFGNAAMTFSRSSPLEFISMATAYRLACDPLGTFRPVVIQQHSNAPDYSYRWGDYGEIEPDPAAARTFWAHHEYTTGSWQTWVARAIVEECGIPGDLDGDGDVDLSDLAILLAAYGVDAGGDLDDDGDTDLADLAILLANYGA
jgi:hypothetical protein